MSKSEQAFDFEPVVANMTLLGLAEQKILASLKVRPSDLNLSWQLAETYRKQGRLREAVELYSHLEKSKYRTNLANDLSAILAGRLEDLIGDTRCCPVPFVLKPQFLASNELLDLQNYIRDRAWGSHKRSTVNAGEYDPQKRQSYDLDVPNWLRERFLNYILTNATDLLRVLNLKTKEVGKIDVSLRAYSDGHFFRIHTDRNSGVHRLLSMAFFFYFEPKQFDGGDLLVFDTDLSALHVREFSHGFTRISATQNTLVIFPSASYHAVSKIQSNAEGYGHCRFAVNAHVWERSHDS